MEVRCDYRLVLAAVLLLAVADHAWASGWDLPYGDMDKGGLHDRRFGPDLARWYIPTNLPSYWTDDHEHPPLSAAEAYGHYVHGPDGLHFWDSHWIRFFYQFVYQMKTSPLRVHSPEAADFVFVPVCLGHWCGSRPTYPLYFNSPRYKWTHSHIDRTSYFFKYAPELLPYLGKKPHVVVYNGAPGGDMARWTAVNFTFIGLEVSPPLDPNRFIPAPYPSHEHHDIHQPLPDLGDPAGKKSKLAVGIYVVRKAISDGTANTRTVLHNSCTAQPDLCTHITWEMTHNMTYKAAAYSAYKTHWYCLQPPGDWVLRGAFYDCLVAGAMPLVFKPNYTNHAAYADVIDYSPFMRYAPTLEELQSKSQDYISFLQGQHTSEKATESLRALHKVHRLFQYAVNPEHLLISWQDRSEQHPLDDAFTFTMKAVLRAMCRQPGFSNSSRCTLGQAKPVV